MQDGKMVYDIDEDAWIVVAGEALNLENGGITKQIYSGTADLSEHPAWVSPWQNFNTGDVGFSSPIDECPLVQTICGSKIKIFLFMSLSHN